MNTDERLKRLKATAEEADEAAADNYEPQQRELAIPLVREKFNLEAAKKELLGMEKAGDPDKVDRYHEEQIAPYVNLIEQAEDKPSEFMRCKQLLQRDLNSDKALMDKIKTELYQRLRGFSGTGSKKIQLVQECLNTIRVQSDRQQAYADQLERLEKDGLIRITREIEW